MLQGSIVIDGKEKSFIDYQLVSDSTMECGPFDFEIRAWDRDRIGLSEYMLTYATNLRGIRRMLDAYTGVSIYRDGFRVHPYGEPGVDWLGLDNRSRQSPLYGLRAIRSWLRFARPESSMRS